MRFATYDDGGTPRAAVVDGADVLYPLPDGTSVLDLVRAGRDAACTAGQAALAGRPGPDAERVRLLPPLEAPTVRDFVAFEEHVEGVRRSMDGADGVVPEWYAAPAFYFSNPYSLIGARDEVCAPPGCAALDFECEVAAVVGMTGRDLTAAGAHDAIFGYAIFNDWSARDLQSAEMRVGLGPAKGKDFASTLGPWLVTADELERYRDAGGCLRLPMTVHVNDREIGRDVLSNMAWTFAELVAYASRGAEVRPGDVLGSGTCGNGGCLAELWGRGHDLPALRPGDVVTMTVDGIGTIRNTVGPPREAATPVPRARTRTPPDPVRVRSTVRKPRGGAQAVEGVQTPPPGGSLHSSSTTSSASGPEKVTEK